MSRMSYKELWEDTRELREAYDKEDKKIYEDLYNRVFDNKTEKTLKSSHLTTKNNKIDFWITVERHPNPVTFFYFGYDIGDIVRELRNDPIIRKYTKLCFYIEESVGPYEAFD